MSQNGGTFLRTSEWHQEFFCGGVTGLINVGITFPINKITFRQMLHGVGAWSAVQQLWQEGVFLLYRGCFPPVLQKTFSLSLMFGTYKEYSSFLRNNFPEISQPLCLCAAAVFAGSTEAILTPFERIQTLLQTKEHHARFQNTFHAFKELQKFGFREYYRGLTPILLRNGPSNILFFSLRDRIPKTPLVNESVPLQYLVNFIIGGSLGVLISTFFYPLNVVKVQMQVGYGGPFISFFRCLKSTYNERGCRVVNMFYGVHANATRSLISWGITNTAYEILIEKVTTAAALY